VVFLPASMIGIGLGMGIAGSGGGGGSASVRGPFPVNAVNFDGSNDRLQRAGDLTGVVNGDKFLASLWFNMAGSDGVLQNFIANGTLGYRITRTAANRLLVRLRTSVPTNLWDFESTATFTVATNPGWNHLLVTANLVASPVAHIFVNDAVLAGTEATAPTTGDISWSAGNHFIGIDDSGLARYDGDLSELYFTDEFLDISVESNRRKFIDGDGFPVDVGSDGSLPTGTAPLVFFNGPTDTWHTNEGSGGGFTENGALTDALTSPSD